MPLNRTHFHHKAHLFSAELPPLVFHFPSFITLISFFPPLFVSIITCCLSASLLLSVVANSPELSVAWIRSLSDCLRLARSVTRVALVNSSIRKKRKKKIWQRHVGCHQVSGVQPANLTAFTPGEHGWRSLVLLYFSRANVFCDSLSFSSPSFFFLASKAFVRHTHWFSQRIPPVVRGFPSKNARWEKWRFSIKIMIARSTSSDPVTSLWTNISCVGCLWFAKLLQAFHVFGLVVRTAISCRCDCDCKG